MMGGVWYSHIHLSKRWGKGKSSRKIHIGSSCSWTWDCWHRSHSVSCVQICAAEEIDLSDTDNTSIRSYSFLILKRETI